MICIGVRAGYRGLMTRSKAHEQKAEALCPIVHTASALSSQVGLPREWPDDTRRTAVASNLRENSRHEPRDSRMIREHSLARWLQTRMSRTGSEACALFSPNMGVQPGVANMPQNQNEQNENRNQQNQNEQNQNEQNQNEQNQNQNENRNQQNQNENRNQQNQNR
jgi:hypothetical protein